LRRAVKPAIVSSSTQQRREHIDRMAKKYLGLDRYPHRKPGEEGVTYKIEPLRVATME
jgi:hypothetical protein